MYQIVKVKNIYHLYSLEYSRILFTGTYIGDIMIGKRVRIKHTTAVNMVVTRRLADGEYVCSWWQLKEHGYELNEVYVHADALEVLS